MPRAVWRQDVLRQDPCGPVILSTCLSIGFRDHAPCRLETGPLSCLRVSLTHELVGSAGSSPMGPCAIGLRSIGAALVLWHSASLTVTLCARSGGPPRLPGLLATSEHAAELPRTHTLAFLKYQCPSSIRTTYSPDSICMQQISMSSSIRTAYNALVVYVLKTAKP